MTDGPKTSRVREALREREDRPDPPATDAGPDRDENRAREMRERVEPPSSGDDG